MWEMIPGRLWQADLADIWSGNADVVVSCSLASELSVLRPRVLHAFFPFEDGQALPDMAIATRLAELVAHYVSLDYRALINCDAGKNRSGLMTGLTLRAYGIRNVVDYIQARHPEAFTAPGPGGPFFAEYLRGTEPG
jgi:hypothetical protein